MNVEEVREYYLGLPHLRECFPFDEETLVLKLGSKMIGFIPLERDEAYLVLKCDPERAIYLREQYEGIEPAWHMNKRHWNGLYLERGLEPKLIKELIQHAYELVWQSLTKREREALGAEDIPHQYELDRE